MVSYHPRIHPQKGIPAFIKERVALRRGRAASWILIMLVLASLAYLATDSASDRILQLPATPRPIQSQIAANALLFVTSPLL